MTLQFELKPSFGRLRFYPIGDGATALVSITGRKCLTAEELETLERGGFKLLVYEDGTIVKDTARTADEWNRALRSEQRRLRKETK